MRKPGDTSGAIQRDRRLQAESFRRVFRLSFLNSRGANPFHFSLNSFLRASHLRASSNKFARTFNNIFRLDDNIPME